MQIKNIGTFVENHAKIEKIKKTQAYSKIKFELVEEIKDVFDPTLEDEEDL